MPASRRQAERREARLRGAGTRKVNTSTFAISFGTPKLGTKTPKSSSSRKRSSKSSTKRSPPTVPEETPVQNAKSTKKSQISKPAKQSQISKPTKQSQLPRPSKQDQFAESTKQATEKGSVDEPTKEGPIDSVRPSDTPSLARRSSSRIATAVRATNSSSQRRDSPGDSVTTPAPNTRAKRSNTSNYNTTNTRPENASENDEPTIKRRRSARILAKATPSPVATPSTTTTKPSPPKTRRSKRSNQTNDITANNIPANKIATNDIPSHNAPTMHQAASNAPENTLDNTTQFDDDQWSDSSEWNEKNDVTLPSSSSSVAKSAKSRSSANVSRTKARSHQNSTKAVIPSANPTRQPIARGAQAKRTAPAAVENRINAVDMVLRKVLDKLDEADKEMAASSTSKGRIADNDKNGMPVPPPLRPPPWKKRTLFRYRSVVEARLRELAEAIDINSAMAQTLRKAEQKRNSLRSQLLDLRSAKLQLQHDMQQVRDQYQRSKQNDQELKQVSEFATALKIFNVRHANTVPTTNSTPTRAHNDLQSLNAQLLLLQPVLGDNGALSRLKSLREKLSRLDRQLSR
ncbi:hypothetical protein TRVA0_045S00452 [Trichomonascus vanleenenianus]|uniref:uncharacterized protein n=1 Tax=Trichomonascus vanleenenianus TaxID=2268995 RepID=UPI003ECAFF5B